MFAFDTNLRNKYLNMMDIVSLFREPSGYVTAILILLAVLLYYVTKNKKLPPGPTGLPILGYFPFLKSEQMHYQLHELGKKYGDIFSFEITGKLYIHLGSHKAMREVLISKSDCFEEKSKFAGELLEDALIFNDGEIWKILRKFYIQAFKDCGLSLIKDEKSGPFYDSVVSLVSDLKAAKGAPVNMTELIIRKISDTVRNIIFCDYDISDKEIQEFCCVYEETVAAATDMKYMMSSKWMKCLYPRNNCYEVGMKSNKKLENIFFKIIQKHEATLDENHLRDVIDNYIMERISRKRKGDPTAEHFTDKRLVSTLIQVLGDGIVGASLFISCAIKSLLDHPEDQEKVYEELINVIGSDRQPCVEDKSKLPYTNAFLYEVMRVVEFLPFAPSVECTRATTLRGYTIPKGAITFLNFWSSNHDPNTYEDPHEFKPSRFVTVPGTPRPDNPIVFGMGKRACIGEYFTTMQIFLYISFIVKNFKISYPEGIKNDETINFITGKILILAEPRQE